jgi:hypothetical protein
VIDALREISTYSTQSLGFSLVKITGTDKSTEVDTIADDQSVVLKSTFNVPIADFEGVFGLPNLDRLNTILNIPEYAENATLTMIRQTREGVDIPMGINFTNATGDFINDYRLMSAEIVTSKLPTPKFNGVKWNVSINPSIQSMQRLKFQSMAAGTEETVFTAKVDKTDLKFYIGDHSTHAGNFVFEHGVKGTLTTPRQWPLKQTISILQLAGDKQMDISDDGAMRIRIDSGLATHDYILLAKSK